MQTNIIINKITIQQKKNKTATLFRTMPNLKVDALFLHSGNAESGAIRGGGRSRSVARIGRSSVCSSASVSPIPIISISPGDDSSESEIETEPAKSFHRRVSTKRNINSSVRYL